MFGDHTRDGQKMQELIQKTMAQQVCLKSFNSSFSIYKTPLPPHLPKTKRTQTCRSHVGQVQTDPV